MNKLTFSLIQKLTHELEEKAVGNRINNITTVNSRDFLIQLTSHREKKILVSLNHHNPFFSFVSLEESVPTITGQNNDIIRKELKDALILGVQTLNSDRILVIDLVKTNDYFEKVKKKIIFEFIPQRSNFLILDESDKILFALNYSPLNCVRPILKGLQYIAPNKKESFSIIDDNTDLEIFEKEAESYFHDSIKKRLLEKFQPLFRYIKSRIKSQKQKLKILEDENDIATHNLKYAEYANTILSLADSKEELDAYLKDENIKLNQDFSIGQNANLLFKKYKKAKRTLEMNLVEKNKAIKEIEKLEQIEIMSNYMNEDDLLEVALELIPNKFVPPKKKVSSKLSYVLLNNTKIYFGKNAKQNNELTFSFAKTFNTYLHIKDYHGAHVIIANDKPTNEELLTAAEICLILSNKTEGDIMYSPISQVKKGNALGEALLKRYQLITLRDVREETKRLVLNWKNN